MGVENFLIQKVNLEVVPVKVDIAVPISNLEHQNSGTYDLEDLLNFYRDHLGKRKSDVNQDFNDKSFENYVRVARKYCMYCYQNDFPFKELSFNNFVKGKSRSYRSITNSFYKYCKENNVNRVTLRIQNKARTYKDELIKLFIEYKSADFDGEKSLEMYSSSITQFYYYMEKHNRNDLSRETFTEYKTHLKRVKKCSDYTIRNYLTVLRQFVKFLINQEANIRKTMPNFVIPQEFFHTVEDIFSIRAKQVIKRFVKNALTQRELQHLIDVIPESNMVSSKNSTHFDNIRDRLMILLMAKSGLRIGELSDLRVKDFSVKKEEVDVLGKGSNDERVTIQYVFNSREIIAYFNLLGQVNGAEYIFTNSSKGKISTQTIRKVINKHLKYAGLYKARRVTPHSLRHTSAHHLLDAGADLGHIKHQLRHASGDTTSIYTGNMEHKKYLENKSFNEE